MANIDNAFSGLKAAVKDLATVEVLTFTGDITTTVGPDGTINWSDLKQIKAPVDGQPPALSLAAATYISADYDTVNFRRDGLDGDMGTLHEQAVETAVDARQAFLQMLVEFVKPSA